MGQHLLLEYLRLTIERIRTRGDVESDMARVMGKRSKKFDLNFFKSLPERFHLMDVSTASGMMIRYASDYLDRLDPTTGEDISSSRAVFTLSSKKVLKIAKNTKGLAQNEAERSISEKSSSDSPIARVYESDPRGYWIVSDLVRPLKRGEETEFMSRTGVDWDEFVSDLSSTIKSGARAAGSKLREDAPEFTRSVYELADKPFSGGGNRQNRLNFGDLARIDHWGVTSGGRVVLLDYGFTEEVYEKEYKKPDSNSKKPPPSSKQDDATVKRQSPMDAPTGK